MVEGRKEKMEGDGVQGGKVREDGGTKEDGLKRREGELGGGGGKEEL